MNLAVRRVAVACLVLFALLLVNANWVQVVHARALRDNPHNVRQTDERLRRERGPIEVAGRAVAQSTPSNDLYAYQRGYPGGALYAQATGYFTLSDATGIERTEGSVLSGDDDRLFVRRLSDLVTGRGRRGGAVELTLNPAAQQAAAAGLGARRGAAVALDVRTGAVLALVSEPSFDPNPLASHDPGAARAAYQRLLADPAQPLLDRATMQTYPPGSLFKVVTTAAALSSGRYTPQSRLPSPTRYRPLPGSSFTLGNFGGETCGDGRTDTLLDALTISCNTAYAGLGVSLGADALTRQAEAFGINAHLRGFPLPTATSVFPTGLDRAQLAESAIGQFDVRITPLQAAMVVAAVANGGQGMRPYLVDTVQGPDLRVLARTQPQQLDRAVSPDVAAQLTQMMVNVVTHGTGTAAQIPGVLVAGKTGTAQHGVGTSPHAWFAGFAPADHPHYAVAVVVEDGGSAGSEATGGTVAAPVARAVLAALLGTGGR